MSFRALLLVALSCSACATMAPKAHAEGFKFEPFGEAGANRELTATFKKSLAASLSNLEPAQVAAQAKSVTVLEKQLPPGIEVKDGVIKAAPESGLEVLGAFHFTPIGGNTFWFADYNSTVKKILCYPQVPLTWVTLAIWMVVPTSWPCFSGISVPVDDGFAYLRLAAQAINAQMVIVVHSVANEESFSGAEGFFLRKVGEAPAPDKDKAPSSI